jgi:hypothetical protein
MLPRTIDGMKHVCYFRHALALDERRVKFQPEYAYGGSATKSEHKKTGRSNEDTALPPEYEEPLIVGPGFVDDTLPTEGEDATNQPQARKDSMGKRPHTMEVWFAGTHSDM